MQKMAARGFNIDSDAVMDALRAAWKELDIQQIMAGEKISETSRLMKMHACKKMRPGDVPGRIF